jgi:cobalt-zinc-cadmium efflux system outer membrane protein
MQSIFTTRSITLGVFSVLLIIPLTTFTALLNTANAATATPKALKTLSSFLQQLESRHPQLRAAQAKTQAAKARSRAASQPLYNPEIQLDSERVGFNSQHVDSVTVGLQQTIDWHNKRSARQNIATVEEQITQLKNQQAKQQLIANIFSALADYQLQREVIQAHNKRLALAKQALSQASRLYKAGDISKLDLEQIRLSTSRSQLTLNQAKTGMARKAQSLATIAGEARKNWPALPYAPPNLQTNKVDYQKLLANLPAFKVANSQIRKQRNVMRLRVREQKADPTIGLRAGGEDSDKVIGLTLSIPLNVRNNHRAEVDEARANIRQAEINLETTKYQLTSQLQSAAQTYQLTYSSWKSWQKIATSSLKQQSHLLMRLWKAGELSTSDYLLQLNQIREAELKQVELKGNVWKAWFNWLAVSNQFKQWLSNKIR